MFPEKIYIGGVNIMKNELISEGEYVANNTPISKFNINEKSKTDPLFRCPKCGDGVRKVLGRSCPTNPPKYIYECDGCDYVTYYPF